MIDFGFELPKRKPQEDLNIVPILDMFVAIIFFLLLSTSFVGYTKLHVPPAQIVISEDLNQKPPVAPQLFGFVDQKFLHLKLQWGGEKPGSLSDQVDLSALNSDPKAAGERQLAQTTKALLQKFVTQFPNEKTLQVSFQAQVSYQELIDVMDGARDLMPDLVLLSPDDVRIGMGGG